MPHPRYTPHSQAVDQKKYRSPAGALEVYDVNHLGTGYVSTYGWLVSQLREDRAAQAVSSRIDLAKISSTPHLQEIHKHPR